MRALLLSLMLALLSPPLWAVKLKLRTEEREAETELVAINGDEVTCKRLRREFIARIDDFEPTSAFAIRMHFTPAQPRPTLELARFALHRDLYAQARETAAAALKMDAALSVEAAAIVQAADVLQAEAMLEQAIVQMTEGKSAEARTLLEAVTAQFASTPAAPRALVLLSSLEGIELERKAALLEAEARKAQEAADTSEQKQRQPVDDWLAQLDAQVKAAESKKMEADADCVANRNHIGLPKYEATVNGTEKIRKAIADNRRLMRHRGQNETADALDARCKKVMVDCYERWAFYLYRMQRFDVASTVCAKGLALEPSDIRLLTLRVNIDEMWNPLEGY